MSALTPLIAATPPPAAQTTVQKSGQPDDILLGDAVAFINGLVDHGSSSAIEIGKYLLKHFFGDDLAKARGRGPRKGISLRRLAEHPDIALTYSALSRAVRVAVQERQITTVATSQHADVATSPHADVVTSQHASANHKILLLGIDNAKGLDQEKALDLKKRYLARIEEERLSVRKLRGLLEADGYVKSRRRVARRELARSGARKLIDPCESISDLDVKRLLDLPADDLRIANNAAKKARLRLDAIINGMEQRLRAWK